VSVARAVEILKAGGLVGLPTETVYGLAADAGNELAVRRIFAAKRRPSSHPLIVHLASAAQLPDWAREIPPAAEQLAKAFWPGPLTMVLRRTPRASDAVTGGQDTVALRVPNHPLALEVLRAFGGGIAAPSANRFGHVSPTTAAHVREELGDELELILDGGPCAVGVESTIVDLTGGTPRLLRPGGVAKEDVERVLNAPLGAPTAEVRAPGMLESHYAPTAGLLLSTDEKAADDAAQRHLWGAQVAVLSAKMPVLPPGVRHFPLPADPAEAARALYATLREIDALGFDVIIAVLPGESGLGLAVRDRLTRAAAPRP
jgi:L-threonylcarbamoyladenylate synthase